jgi:hypothetical protein
MLARTGIGFRLPSTPTPTFTLHLSRRPATGNGAISTKITIPMSALAPRDGKQSNPSNARAHCRTAPGGCECSTHSTVPGVTTFVTARADGLARQRCLLPGGRFARGRLWSRRTRSTSGSRRKDQAAQRPAPVARHDLMTPPSRTSHPRPCQRRSAAPFRTEPRLFRPRQLYASPSRARDPRGFVG